MHAAIGPAHRPWLPDVEKPEQREPNEHPPPLPWCEEQREPHADHLVPHQRALVVHAEATVANPAGPYAEQKPGDEHREINARRHIAQQEPHGSSATSEPAVPGAFGERPAPNAV